MHDKFGVDLKNSKDTTISTPTITDLVEELLFEEQTSLDEIQLLLETGTLEENIDGDLAFQIIVAWGAVERLNPTYTEDAEGNTHQEVTHFLRENPELFDKATSMARPQTWLEQAEAFYDPNDEDDTCPAFSLGWEDSARATCDLLEGIDKLELFLAVAVVFTQRTFPTLRTELEKCREWYEEVYDFFANTIPTWASRMAEAMIPDADGIDAELASTMNKFTEIAALITTPPWQPPPLTDDEVANYKDFLSKTAAT